MIIVYSKQNCPACEQAKHLLTTIGKEFKVVDTTTDFDAFELMIDNGHRSFPQIYQDGKLLIAGGFAGLKAAHERGEI